MACMRTLSGVCSLLAYRHLICAFFIKIFIIISINRYNYACDHLGPSISLDNNSLGLKTSHWLNILIIHINI